jgi:hypothetical protein
MTNNPQNRKFMPENRPLNCLEITKRLIFASIGFLAISHDNLEKYVDKLELRGRATRRSKPSKVQSRVSLPREYNIYNSDFVQRAASERINNMDLPSKADINELSIKISTLEKKIDEINIEKYPPE